MILIDRPKHYLQVSEKQFEKILRECADYRREGYCGAVRYLYAYNRSQFAVVLDSNGKEQIYVDPTLL